MSAEGTAFKIFSAQIFCMRFFEFLNKPLSYAKGPPIPILKALSERRGNRFQKFSERKIFALDFRISKWIPFVCQRAPSQILKALNERRGNRFQKFSTRSFFAREFRISK